MKVTRLCRRCSQPLDGEGNLHPHCEAAVKSVERPPSKVLPAHRRRCGSRSDV